MPKSSKINKLPKFKVVRIALSQCEPALFYPQPQLSVDTTALLDEQLRSAPEGLSACWGIAVEGLAQVFLGAYQLDWLQRHHPNGSLPVRVAETGQFSPAEMANLMLHPGNVFPENDMVFHASALEGLRQSFGLSDQALAQYTGMSRSTIANTRRLLGLHPDALQAAQQGRLSYTIARELLTVTPERQQTLVQEFSRQLMSSGAMLDRIRGKSSLVAEVDAKPDSVAANSTGLSKGQRPAAKSADTIRYEQMIADAMGYPTEIREGTDGRGQLVFTPYGEAGAAHIAQQIPEAAFRQRARLVLDYNNYDELEAMLAKLFPPEEDF